MDDHRRMGRQRMDARSLLAVHRPKSMAHVVVRTPDDRSGPTVDLLSKVSNTIPLSRVCLSFRLQLQVGKYFADVRVPCVATIRFLIPQLSEEVRVDLAFIFN